MTFKRKTKEEFTDYLASFLPNGRLFEAKFIEDSILRKYLQGKAPEFVRLNDLFNTHIEQLDPNITENYLEEWEAALKIPDNCIPLASAAQERRDNIILKLGSLSIQTEDDYKELASFYGFTITFVTDEFPPYSVPFTPLGDEDLSFFPPYNVPFTPLGDATESTRFVFYVKGDFDSDPTKAAIFQCLIRKLVPSTYRVIFITE